MQLTHHFEAHMPRYSRLKKGYMLQCTMHQPVETMDGAQVLEVVLLGQDEDDGVVAVPPARVNLDGCQKKQDLTQTRL